MQNLIVWSGNVYFRDACSALCAAVVIYANDMTAEMKNSLQKCEPFIFSCKTGQDLED